jgi:hypothetical protein
MSGSVLRFMNQDHLFPVYQFQSLLLATASELAATMIVAERGANIADLKAWEPCCGGGPAAVTLKHLGVGYVQATDISDESIAACRANAAANAVSLDRIAVADLLADSDQDRRYDLICCNPPCAPDVSSNSEPASLLTAVRGGDKGIELTLRLLDQVGPRLTPGGSLVFVAVSTSDIASLRQRLDEDFHGQWRTFPTTPVAAPYRSAEDEASRWLTDGTAAFEPIVWRRKDGWYWRLTWIVEVSNGRLSGTGSGFALCPYGLEVDRDRDLSLMISKFSSDGFWLR